MTTRGVDSKSLSTLSFGATSVIDAAKRKPDVALVMNVANGYWLPLLRARRIPSVVNVDGIEWKREKWSRTGKAVFRLGATLTARYADTVIADSTQIGAFWLATFRRDSVFIPYGGDLLTDSLAPIDDLAPRRYILLVARFVPENTIGEFLDAARSLANSHPIVIVGSSGSGGELEQRVGELADSHPGVTWLGHISDDQKLYALWQNCGAYFHGHSVGGTNPALVQAMACGAPILARDTPFNREVLEDAGMFVQGTPDGIDHGARRLLSDPELQESLSARAKERARQAYSWDAVCESYEASLHMAMNAHGTQ
jgi:glycosyltransferase involved in cell wall biosynthesis